MKNKIYIVLMLLILYANVFADVPHTQTHSPTVPYFMERMNFQTTQLKIFSPEISGMVMDKYSDLNWNPANILQNSTTSLYLDFNISGNNYESISIPTYNYENDAHYLIPGWHQQTSINSMQMAPHYNFAIIKPISSKLVLGFVNRSLFDYSPYRSSTYWTQGGWRGNFAMEDSYSQDIFENLDPQTLEVDDNQQKVWGTQSEFSIGYKLTGKIDLGLRLGHYIFRRDGTLYDSKWGYHPHSSYAVLNDEELDISGDHTELGAGLIYHLNKKTKIGIFGSIMNGNAEEQMASIDTSDHWSERDTDAAYYNINEHYLESDDKFTSEATHPKMTITFEKRISDNLVFRSFFSGSKVQNDITSSIGSSDTSYQDRTYDQYYSDNYHFRREESHGSRLNSLDGTGEIETTDFKLFTSLIYATENDWSLFGGILIHRQETARQFDEESNYFSHNFTEYMEYDEETHRNIYSQEKIYRYKYNYDKWSAFIPIGAKVQVIKGFHLLLGTDIILELYDDDEKGQLLYPEKITRRWEDNNLIVDDEETDRYEEFSSNPAKNFQRYTATHFGISYEHSSGMRFYIKSDGDIFHTNSWSFGFEKVF